MAEALRLIVPGEPVPWQRARRQGQRYFTHPIAAEFAERVQTAWLVEGRPKLGLGPLELVARFYFARKPSHLLKDGSLRKSAPEYPPRVDADNLLKGVSDALNGHLYADDSQLVRVMGEKVYAGPGEEARTELEVRALG